MNTIQYIGSSEPRKEKPRLYWDDLKGVDWTLGVEPLPWGTPVIYHHLVAVVRGQTGPSKESLAPTYDFKAAGWESWRKDYKGLWIWPAVGEAIVLGVRKKMIGYIDAGGGFSSYSGDYDPPTFAALASVPLLVLSPRNSIDVAYAPFWGVTPLPR